jgi:hypothetical protein
MRLQVVIADELLGVDDSRGWAFLELLDQRARSGVQVL